jgi:cytidylate kinase
MIVAIDGPGGSGKSTVAKLLSQKLNFLYLDTGAMYRALTWSVLAGGFDLGDKEKIIQQARTVDIEFKDQRVFLGGRDVTSEIRLPQVDAAISKIAEIPEVREEMVRIQRRIGGVSNCVVEGRDTTTVVFPQASFKIFLDADISERARRRLSDFKKKNIPVEYRGVCEELKRRDSCDMQRKVGALKRAQDAVYLDTTNLSIDQVVGKIYALIKKSHTKDDNAGQ